MSHSIIPGPRGGDIEVFWLHQSFVLAGLRKIADAMLHEAWSDVLLAARLLNHMQKLSGGMTQLIDHSRNLPAPLFPEEVSHIISSQLWDTQKIIHEVLGRVEDLLGPAVPNPDLAILLDEAYLILYNVRLAEDQHRYPESGFLKWLNGQMQFWDQEIRKSLRLANA